MKITLSWLKAHLKTDHDLTDLIEGLNALGLVVDDCLNDSLKFKNILSAEIIDCHPHPQADRLQVCQVNTGTQLLQIVCGAPNARPNLKTVLALPGASVPISGQIIKEGLIRGVQSQGMLCSATELGLDNDQEGILELPASAAVGADFATFQGTDDPVLVIDITPNRGDCLGVRGIARDLAAAGYGMLIPLEEVYPGTINETQNLAAPSITIDAETSAQGAWCYIDNITNAVTPGWIQHRLKRCGHSCISAVVDVTNYLCYDLGRPLHAFDANKITGGLHLRYAKENETFVALNQQSYTLQDTMHVVADDQGPVALAGIMGGLDSAYQPNSQRILLESAFFPPHEIAQTGRKVQIHSDSRYRFERFVDPQSSVPGLKIAAQLIAQITGGKVGKIHEQIKTPVPISLAFSEQDVEKRCGLSMESTEIEQILGNLGFGVTREGNTYLLTVPSWRPDITCKEDIVEELVRVKGYETIPCSVLPLKPRVTTPSFIDQNRYISRFLTSRGFNELVTWSFISEKNAELFQTKDYHQSDLTLSNPLNPDLAVMRPSVLPGLIDAVGRNTAYSQNDVAFFEIGPQFRHCAENGQHLMVAGLRCGQAQPLHWSEKNRLVDIYDVKADILGILATFGIQETSLQIIDTAPQWYHPGRSATIHQGPSRILGYFGEIHPRIQKTFSCKNKLVAFELFKDFLGFSLPSRKQFKISSYQKVERDFSFKVPLDITADQLVKIIKKVNKNLVQTVEVFDVFTLPAPLQSETISYKSIGLRVSLQSFEKTLTSAEIEDFCQNVLTTIENQTHSILRKN